MHGNRNYLYDVFLSHSSEDKEKVGKLAKLLKEKNLKVWFDSSQIDASNSIPTRIQDGIKSSRHLIFCISNNSIKSDWVSAEWQGIFFQDPLNSKGRLVLLLLEDVDAEVIPPLIVPLKRIDWRNENSESLLELITICSAGPQKKGRRRRDRSTPFFSAPSGAMSMDESRYIERWADKIVINAACQQTSETITIKGPWQIGKSSLLARYHANSNGKCKVLIDIGSFPQQHLENESKFFQLLGSKIWNGMGRPAGVSVPPQLELDQFGDLVESLLNLVDCNVSFAFDNVDKVLGKNYHKNFFSMLRTWHNNRAFIETWSKLSLALVISTEPYLLVDSEFRSPFNVGAIVELDSFSEIEFNELRKKYKLKFNQTELTRLVDLVGGHPYLIQLALAYLSAPPSTQIDFNFNDWLDNAANRRAPFGEHLRELRQKLGADLVTLFQEMIAGKIACKEDDFYRLYSVGLIRKEKEAIIPSCKLYKQFFGKG